MFKQGEPDMLRHSMMLFVLFLSLSTANAGDNKTNADWQYIAKTFELVSDQVLSNQLNTLGSDGWELVICTEENASLTCVFKRPAK